MPAICSYAHWENIEEDVHQFYTILHFYVFGLGMLYATFLGPRESCV